MYIFIYNLVINLFSNFYFYNLFYVKSHLLLCLITYNFDYITNILFKAF